GGALMHQAPFQRADLVVYGGTVVTEGAIYPATIVAREGRIVAIEEHAGRGPSADETIDATGMIVIPGGIDPHPHFEEPGPSAWREGFETGTMACAAGGVTTTLEHPLSIPPVADAPTFVAKQEVA